MQMSSLTYLVIFLKINILAVHRAQEEDNMLIFKKVMLKLHFGEPRPLYIGFGPYILVK